MTTISPPEQQRMDHLDKVSRLPKWAKDRITLLESELRDREAQITAMSPDAKSNTAWWGSHPRSLPDHSTIQFTLGENHWERINVRLDKDRGGLYVQDHGRLRICPEASNTFRVYLETP